MEWDGELIAVKTKAIMLLVFSILLIFPLTLFAQQPETNISADQITVQADNILQAEGNVIIRRGNVFIKANVMTVNNEASHIEFEGITDFYDGKSLKLTGKDALLSNDLSSGIINAAQVLIDDTIRLRAEQIKLKNSTLERVENISRITSCKECESRLPLWYFTASSATNGVQNQNIIYRDVTLRVSGFPIGYTPYLRLPYPAVDRARGFLIPGLTITSNLGFGAQLPYFVPIGDSRDLLLTPYISPKTKTIEYRYRQKFSDGDLTINGAFSEDDILNKDTRSYYKAIGRFELAYGLELKIKAGMASDDTYLEDYAYGSEDDLTTEISLGKVVINNDKLFRGDLNYVRDNREDNSLEEFYTLSGFYNNRIDQTFLPGNLFFEAEANSSLNLADGDQVRRPPSFAASEVRYTNDRNVGPMRIVGQSFSRINSFVNSEILKAWEEITFGMEYLQHFHSFYKRNTLVHKLSPVNAILQWSRG